ncbi:MAG: hypothetical protein ACOYNN_12655 [Terrimicrobiaceae bacterium]
MPTEDTSILKERKACTSQRGKTSLPNRAPLQVLEPGEIDRIWRLLDLEPGQPG